MGWKVVVERLGRGAPLSVDELLGALDAAGQAADTRALLAVDSINEGPARHWWPEQLSEFLVEAGRYPYVAVLPHLPGHISQSNDWNWRLVECPAATARTWHG